MANHLPTDRLEHLYDVVFHLVADHGYEAVRMDRIAREARVSTATLYRHWGSKSRLVVGVLSASGGVDAEAPEDTGTLLGDLHAAVDPMADAMPQVVRFLLSITLAMRDDQELAEAYRAHGLPVLTNFVQVILDRALARGEIQPSDKLVQFLTASMLAPWAVAGVLLAESVHAASVHEYIDAVVAPSLSLSPHPKEV